MQTAQGLYLLLFRAFRIFQTASYTRLLATCRDVALAKVELGRMSGGYATKNTRANMTLKSFQSYLVFCLIQPHVALNRPILDTAVAVPGSNKCGRSS